MDKLAKLVTDIGKLWEHYSAAYFTGIQNTLILAVAATLAGCLIGLLCGVLNKIRYTEHLFRAADINAVVRHRLLLFHCSFCSADIQPAVDLHRIAADDLTMKALCQCNRKRCFSACRRVKNPIK